MKLAARRQPRFQMYVIAVIEARDDGDRDDVAVGFFESASDKQLVSFIGSETGRRVVDRLYDELVGQGGYVGGDEEKQGKRVVHARGTGVSVVTFEDEASNALVFPLRMGGFTVYDDAPTLANRLANGNVPFELRVRDLGIAYLQAETRTI